MRRSLLITVTLGALLNCKGKAEPTPARAASSATASSSVSAVVAYDPSADTAACRAAIAAKQYGKAQKLSLAVTTRSDPSKAEDAKALQAELDKAIAGAAKEEDLAIAKAPPRSFKSAGGGVKATVLRTYLAREFHGNNFGTGDTTSMADKGNVFIVVDVDVTSTAKAPTLPCILLASREKGEAKLKGQGPLTYTFRRWDNYASYLGNNSDRGNDFAMTDTVKFAMPGELPADLSKNQ